VWCSVLEGWGKGRDGRNERERQTDRGREREREGDKNRETEVIVQISSQFCMRHSAISKKEM
jgi:hypothetical protein